MPEDTVKAILERRVAPLAGLVDRQGEDHNVFLRAISPTLAVASKLSRSLTSTLGGVLAGVARDLAIDRYGEAAVPPVVTSKTVTTPPRAIPRAGNDTAIYTQLPETATKAATDRLIRRAFDDPLMRIGTDGFRTAFREELGVLVAGTRAAEPWIVQVDLLVQHPGIGLAELESGGELDTSNSRGQSSKLVLAALALANPDVPMHFCTAYANRGEGQPIAGGLAGYLSVAGATTPSSGLLIGAAWWNRLLPVDVSHARFLELFGEVCREMRIAP